LFREVADALRTKEYWREALQFYDPLQLVEGQTDPAYFSDMASCYEALAMYDEAEDCVRIIIENDKENMAAWIQVATMFDNADMPDRAAPYVDQVITMKRGKALEKKRARSAAKPSLLPGMELNGRGPSLPPEELTNISSMIDSTPAQKAIGRRSKRQVAEAEIEKRVQSTYFEMRRLRERLRLGETGVKTDWMEGARTLIDQFKKHKSYSPMDKNASVLGFSRRERMAKGDQGGEEMGVTSGRLQNLLGLEFPKVFVFLGQLTRNNRGRRSFYAKRILWDRF
jgi:general transcription factor 3C polypeptide 3 (transcription factor C subunit 4)